MSATSQEKKKHVFFFLKGEMGELINGKTTEKGEVKRREGQIW
jgi:hypothetical protein